MRKDAEHYGRLPGRPDDLPYVWPVRSEAAVAAERRKAENEERRRFGHSKGALDAERLRRKRSRAAKKAWQTATELRPGDGRRFVLPTTDDSPATRAPGSSQAAGRSRLESSCRSVWSVERRAWSTDPRGGGVTIDESRKSP